MGGAAADKIRKKWKGLHGGLDLPLVQLPQEELMIANAGDDIIKTLPRGGYYRNSHRDALKSGDLTKDELLDKLKRAAPHLIEGV